ncbi:MAG: glutamate-5-semialdehyde dehydrogenase [Ruminococcaceae bacterium]|nr:glutamate-5-semialdehyde dehydrogenase [Oscillospiraceae bacterium]
MVKVLDLAIAAKKSSIEIAHADSKTKDGVLLSLAKGLVDNSEKIISANRTDIEFAKKNSLSEAMIERLTLDDKRIRDMANSLIELASLPDPVGKIINGSTRPNGLVIAKKQVPLGVVALIYESRPNVTVDSASLCIKSGNAVILRGGKEAINSNIELVRIIKEALSANGLSEDIVGLVTDTSRDSSIELMGLSGYVDLLIPRGGKALIEATVKNAKVPVIETGAGNCHIYVDEFADLEMSTIVVNNAKTQRPSVCNAVETVLVHEKVAERFLKMMAEGFTHEVELRGDLAATTILKGIKTATDEDWYTEYNDYILTVGVVSCVEEACEIINRCGTRHSDAIMTENVKNAEYFLENVDSSAVYLNASTRFTDGGEFGMSAEMGISTDKLHVRGPIGLDALTTTKFIVLGKGQIR